MNDRIASNRIYDINQALHVEKLMDLIVLIGLAEAMRLLCNSLFLRMMVTLHG